MYIKTEEEWVLTLVLRMYVQGTGAAQLQGCKHTTNADMQRQLWPKLNSKSASKGHEVSLDFDCTERVIQCLRDCQTH